jgi:hypothetical protein
VRNVASEVFPARSQNSRPCRQEKKNEKKNSLLFSSFSSPELLTWWLLEEWLLGYFLLPIFTSSGGKGRKKGVVAEHFFFSRWMSQCRKWTTLYSGTHSRSSFARYGASSNHKKRSPKKITIKREREREKLFEWISLMDRCWWFLHYGFLGPQTLERHGGELRLIIILSRCLPIIITVGVVVKSSLVDSAGLIIAVK